MNALILTADADQGLEQADIDRIGAVLDASIAPNTARAYRAGLARFAAWLAGRPATDATIAAYVAWLAAEGKAPATIKQAAAAIGAGARAQGADDPRGPLTRQALKGAVRQNAGLGRGQARGLRREEAVAAAAIAAADGSAKGLRDAALLRVLSDTLLRGAEAVALQWADLELEADGSGRLAIRRSKTDQEAEGAVAFLTPETVAALTAWRQAVAAVEGRAQGAMFRPVTRGGNVVRYGRQSGLELTTETLRAIVRERAAAAGVEGCSGHSTRVGSAQSLVERGASTAAVAVAGRWRDPGMVVRYSKAQAAGRGAVASYFSGK